MIFNLEDNLKFKVDKKQNIITINHVIKGLSILLHHKKKEKLQRRLKSQFYKSTKIQQAKILTLKKSKYKIRKGFHKQSNKNSKNNLKL